MSLRSVASILPARSCIFTARCLHSTPHTRDGQVERSASAKLFADAEAEERAASSRRSQRIDRLLFQNENWTGDEKMEDAVLRMLVDKYKPLRSGTIQSAEEKIRQRKDDVVPLPFDMPPPVSPSVPAYESPPPPEPVIPPSEHRPWHVTFRAPSHARSPQIKFGHIKSSKNSTPIPLEALNDPRARAAFKASRKRAEIRERITAAKESTLDYRIGQAKASGISRGANPTSLRGWTNLIEDRIERAKAAGMFDNLTGRGKPIERDLDERNPYLAREEYLMNRIVKKNGAVPPWIELQRELEEALESFRLILRDAWVRRATRMLALSRVPHDLRNMSAEEASKYRDSEWEARESAYHTKAIEDINSLVRKYNTLAPYTVRRPYVTKSAELQRCFESAGEDMVRVFTSSNSSTGSMPTRTSTGWKDEDEATTMPSGDTQAEGMASRVVVPGFSIREFVGRILSKLSR